MKIYNLLQTIAAVAILLSTSIIGQGQAYGEIHGTVLDDLGNPMPMAGIQVNAGEIQYTVITDMDGKFKVKPLPSGIYNAEISFISYRDYPLNGINVDPDRITRLDPIKMVLDTEEFGAADVFIYVKPLIDVDNTGMTTITATELEHIPAVKNLGNFVAQMSSEISTNAEGTELYFRGSRAGTSQYIVDGVKIIGQAPRIPQSGLGSISVYTGGVPAKYGDVTGGVIVIETKNYFDEYNKKKYENK